MESIEPGGQIVKVLVQVQRSENQEHWYPRTGEGGCSNSSRVNKFIVLPLFLSIKALNGLDDNHLYWLNVIFFTQSTN